MASQQGFPKNGKSPLKYWWVPLEVQSFKPDLVVLNGNLSAPPTSCPKEGLLPERRENNRLTVSHVRSAVAGIWDRVGQPAIFLSKNIFKCDNNYSKHVLFQLDSDRDVQTVYEDTRSFGKDAEVSSRNKSSANSSFEDLHGIKKMLLFASCNRNVNSFYFQRTAASAEENNIANKFSNGIDGNMIPKPFSGIKDLVNFTKTGFHTLDESCTIGKTTSNLPDSQNIQNFGKSVATDLVTNTSGSIKYEQKLGCSMSSPHDLQSSTCTREETEILRQPISECKNSCDVDFISSVVESHDCQNLINTIDVVLKSSKENSAANYQNTNKNEKFFGSLSLVENFPQQQWLAIQNNLQHTFSNNRHAIAGALAGTLVTLCLHPVDTVKTIIQANATGQKSFYRIVRRIVSQHGILGLYRGIASNITSSAPISAIYTFTYESVKCTLLPLLPKEYHSLAHCIAGGCSSVATSFVFTPSERIKQQMQVGLQYQNCWKALIGCLQKGGIPSLYAGWGAVLCRNIPHSIIKFYTYESLKQFFSSAYPDSSFQTFHTLICGGLAGSTAALFTTPFDVVKTRLQTQPPGSIGKYHGVFHALQEIARQEGLPGLYRGLAPRLAMYVSQGAIFFASYEFLKAIFLSEASQHTSKMKEDEMSSDSPAAAVLQKQPT